MYLSNLHALHDDMTAKGLTRIAYSCRFESLQLKVAYLADYSPPLLLVGCPEKNVLLQREVPPTFIVSAYIPKDVYLALIAALRQDWEAAEPYAPQRLLHAVDDQTPTSALREMYPHVRDIAALSRDLEDPEKHFFYAWRFPGNDRNKPTEGNLRKIMRFYGAKVYDYCRSNHVSCVWTALRERANKFYPPWKR